MPFKLRLKRSRQYNVVSKSLFVISVELLDSASIECTLTAESVGRECLDNICQRLSFQQPEFFGLRYITHNGAPRWVELERPLKRQLDKHARNYVLYLRVMYYVSGVSLITDEVTRYHYFLQLKSDVIEGRIRCNTEQAILLASYSMQAEFGNHDVERHTSVYLKDFALFPKHLIEEGLLESLTEAVIFQHAALAGLPQGTAEEYYILAAQQLEGYGQEVFLAKDNSGNEVLIAISLSGITITNRGSHTSRFYKWKEITNVINHKRHFEIECQVSTDTVNFLFPDVESAKYVWRMCVHQHTFYIQCGQSSVEGSTADIVRALFHQNGVEESHLTNSHEELDVDQADHSRVMSNERINRASWEGERIQSTSCLDLASGGQEIEKLRAMLPEYRQAPDYETAVKQKLQNPPGNNTPNGSSTILYSSHPDIHTTHVQRVPYERYPDIARVDTFFQPTDVPVYLTDQHVIHTYSTPELDMAATSEAVQGMQMLHLYKPPPPYPINRPSSNSTPDLASPLFSHYNQRCYINNHVSGSSPDLVSSRMHAFGFLNSRSDLRLLPNPAAHKTYTNLPSVLDARRMEQVKARLNVADTYHRTGDNQYIATPEPIYENVQMLWTSSENVTKGDSNECTNGGGSLQEESTTAATTTSDEITEKHSSKVATIKQDSNLISSESNNNNFLRISGTSSTNVSANTSTDSSQSGAGSKDRNHNRKGKKKWGGILGGGGGKHKAWSHKHEEDGSNKMLSRRQSLPISKEATCQMLEKKLQDSQLMFEFEKIPRIKSNADFSTASLPENVARNRQKDILPYEENRVRLSPSKENRLGYINASNLTASIGNQQKFYIAAQSPLAATLSHFWQMIWEADVYLVVNLMDLDDNSAPYHPMHFNERPLEIGGFKIWSQFSQETGHCITTKLRVFHNATKRVRGIWHLQYKEWAGDGCPKEVSHFLGFLEELRSVRQHTMMEIPSGHNKNPPVLVHCSTGVSRTAVTILSDLLLYTIDFNQELDIARVVLLMRHQRMLMVETVYQYRFVHSLLAYYLKNSRLI